MSDVTRADSLCLGQVWDIPRLAEMRSRPSSPNLLNTVLLNPPPFFPLRIHPRRINMDLDETQILLKSWLRYVVTTFQKLPGSAVLVRYVQSSYQNDPIRSAIELVLVIFFIRYLLSPSYSTQKQNYVKLRDDVRHQPI